MEDVGSQSEDPAEVLHAGPRWSTLVHLHVRPIQRQNVVGRNHRTRRILGGLGLFQSSTCAPPACSGPDRGEDISSGAAALSCPPCRTLRALRTDGPSTADTPPQLAHVILIVERLFSSTASAEN